MNAVLGIYARETGEGMVFNDSGPEAPPPGEPADPSPASAPAEPRRAHLKVVK